MDNSPAAARLEQERSTGSSSLIVSIPRHDHLLQTGQAVPRFLQGVFPFVGRGMFRAIPLDDTLAYTVPDRKIAEVVYFRAGNLSDDLIYLALWADDNPIRYFPIGPKSDIHVPLAIVDSHPTGVRIQIGFAASHRLTGTVILDVGILEISAGTAGGE